MTRPAGLIRRRRGMPLLLAVACALAGPLAAAAAAPAVDAAQAADPCTDAIESAHPDARSHCLARAEAGDRVAQYNLATLLIDAGEHAAAEQWLRRAWDGGLVNAGWLLGTLALGQQRADEGRQWLERAAEAGHPDAAFDLATVLLESGGATAFDAAVAARARHWYEVAAARGDAGARYNLALLLIDTRVPGADPALAWAWLAAVGDINAESHLPLREMQRGIAETLSAADRERGRQYLLQIGRGEIPRAAGTGGTGPAPRPPAPATTRRPAPGR